MNHSCVSLPRSLSVWLASGGLLAGLALWVAPRLSTLSLTATEPAFDQVLLWSCSLGALLAAGWLWLAITVVTASAWRGRPHATFPGIPAGLLRLVLAACGVALAGGLIAPGAATSTPGSAERSPGERDDLLQGLPLPDRAVGVGGSRPLRSSPESTVEVRVGDTLWGLAAHQLPGSTDPAMTSALWHRIYAANRSVIGSDPDLIHPGQRLRLPPARPVPRPPA